MSWTKKTPYRFKVFTLADVHAFCVTVMRNKYAVVLSDWTYRLDFRIDPRPIFDDIKQKFCSIGIKTVLDAKIVSNIIDRFNKTLKDNCS